MLLSLLFIVTAFANEIQCPEGTLKIDFTPPSTGMRTVFCNKKIGSKYVKHGPEFKYNKSGNLIEQNFYNHGVLGKATSNNSNQKESGVQSGEEFKSNTYQFSITKKSDWYYINQSTQKALIKNSVLGHFQAARLVKQTRASIVMLSKYPSYPYQSGKTEFVSFPRIAIGIHSKKDLKKACVSFQFADIYADRASVNCVKKTLGGFEGLLLEYDKPILLRKVTGNFKDKHRTKTTIFLTTHNEKTLVLMVNRDSDPIDKELEQEINSILNTYRPL